MSYPVFMVPAGDILPIFFDSYDGGTGASVTLTGLAVTDIEIYKDGSATQRSSDAGYTLLDTDGIDFDTITGIHGFSIDTGDNTDASFYTVGSWFTVVVSAVTIDAQTVNFVAAQFRIMAAESVAGKPKVDVDAWLGTAAATPTVAGVPEVDLTHVAGATTNVAALATNVDAILTDTAVIGAAGAGLTALATQTSVNTIDDFLDTEIAAIKAKTDNLPAAPAATGDIPSAATIADAVWDEAIAGHVAAGSTGEALGDASAAGDPWGTALPGAYGAGTAGKIIGDNINATISSRASQTSVDTIDDLLDTEIGALTTAVADIPTNAELATALGTADDATLAAIAALNNLSSAQVTAAVPTAAQNADALLDRNIAGGSNGGRDVTSALRGIRNKVSITAGTLTVTEEDDATPAWTAAVTTTAGNPISSVDPA